MTPKKIGSIVDKIGELRGQAAKINDEIDALKSKLIEADVSEGHGELFQVKMSVSERKVVDWKKIQEDYELPVENYTSVTQSTSMRVSARKKN